MAAETMDGLIVSTPVEDFDLGQEGFSSDPSASDPTILGDPMGDPIGGYQEGYTSEGESASNVLADPTLSGNVFGTILELQKRGPKADPDAPHNKKIREIGERNVSEGGTIIAGGGVRPEVAIPTPGGIKSSRRPDILYVDQDGKVGGMNVGRTRPDGTPIKREVEALSDLNENGDLETEFERYD
jgi:hypothetical protein